jgi:peptidylprolyl isomerase
VSGGPRVEGRRSASLGPALWLLLTFVLLADALRAYLARFDLDPEDVVGLIRLSVIAPADVALAALAALVAFGAQRGLGVALRWRRTALILGWLYGAWSLSQGGVAGGFATVVNPDRAVVGAATIVLATLGFVAVGRAARAPDAAPFALLDPGLAVHDAPSGLRYQDVDVGIGPLASHGRTAVVHYTGWLADGRKFDSSRDRGRPFEFQVGQGRVIRAWDEGVATMRQGGRRRLIVPPALGYGAAGAGAIPGGATLVFDLELVDVR